MKKLFNIKSHYQRVKEFYLRYERILMPATLVIGFLIDYVTFANIKIEFTFTLLFFYWILAGLTIAFINFYDAQKISTKLKYIRLFSPLIIQFSFGALLSSSLVFYWLSGAFSISWPILLIVVLLMVFNEVFRQYFLMPITQISVYFFTTISLFSLTLPFVFHSLSAWLFILAGVLSLAIFGPYIYLLYSTKNYTSRQKKYALASIVAIFGTMNVLYFTNVIPPIPLSLREAGLYHSIQISNGSYTMQSEVENIWEKITPGQTIHIIPNQKIYLYTAIFAPKQLEAKILHYWQYYDEQKKEWVNQDTLSFTITGGRKEGYKGYSFKSNLTPGKWRVYVKNQRGQVLGRIQFTVEKTTLEVKLQETIR